MLLLQWVTATEIGTLIRNLQYVALGLEPESVIGGWENNGMCYGVAEHLLKGKVYVIHLWPWAGSVQVECCRREQAPAVCI